MVKYMTTVAEIMADLPSWQHTNFPQHLAERG